MALTQIPISGLAGGGFFWSEDTDSGAGTVNFNSPTFEKIYTLIGPTNESAAVGEAESHFASQKTITVNGVVLFIFDYKISPDSADGLVWKVRATYKYQVAFVEMSFDTSGAHAKVLQALDEGDYYNCKGIGSLTDFTPAGQLVPDFGGLVGVNGENVEGVDVPIQKFDFTILTRLKLSTMPSSYIQALRKITGRCNNAALNLTWKGQVFPFGVEELLFLGVPGKQNSDDDVEFTLKFSAQESHAGGTRLTADFRMPDVGSDEALQFQTTVGMSPSQEIFIVGAGIMVVAVVVDGTNATVTNPGSTGNAAPGTIILSGSLVSFDGMPPISVGRSLPIKKLGWRYLWTSSKPRLTGGALVGGQLTGARRTLQPQAAVVNKVIPSADLSIIGIFS